MRSIPLLLAALAISACVTTPEATAEERAYCERMERDMGVHTAHDHQQMKGAGMNAMNVTHERCQRILAQPVS